MSDRETIDVYDARAADYDRLVMRDTPDAELQGFLHDLPPKARVLDLGCGPGRSAAIMARAGHRVTALDASSEMVARAAQHPGVAAVVGTFDDIPEGPFDGVWANFSLLHAPRADLPRHLSAIAAALTEGGVFHIGMKLGTGAERDRIGRFYTYVTQDELEGLLSAAGLAIHARSFGRDAGLSGEDADWIVLRARKYRPAGAIAARGAAGRSRTG